MRTLPLAHLFLEDLSVERVHATSFTLSQASRDLDPVDSYTLVFSSCGALTVETDRDTFALTGDALLLLLPKTPVHIHADAAARLFLLRLSLSDADGEPLVLSDACPSAFVHVDLALPIEELCIRYQQGSMQSDIENAARAMLLRLSRERAEREFSAILPAIDYIRAHLCEDVRVDTVAALCDMCESSLRREFSRAIGMSPKAYILRQKLKMAARMLHSGLYSIKEICEHLGFYDDAYFSKLFKRHTGMTPMQYARGSVTV